MRLLKHVRHENVISLLDAFSPQTSLETFEDVYLVTHLMGTDLNSIIKTQSLSDDHVQFFVYQILRGLKYLHSAGILHKILEFGLPHLAETEMTEYVPTRWYRAPEIAFNWMDYSQTEDIWSVGCIMAEILKRTPLFPGNDNVDQLTRILYLRGTPSSKIIDKIQSIEAKNAIASMPKRTKKSLKEVFINADPKAVDLLELMLDLDAEQRNNAEAALAHPYLEQYAASHDEPTAERFEDAFEGLELDISEWKKLVYDKLQSFKQG